MLNTTTLQYTWRPWNGIVFNSSSSGTTRSKSTFVAPGVDQEGIEDTNEEDHAAAVTDLAKESSDTIPPSRETLDIKYPELLGEEIQEGEEVQPKIEQEPEDPEQNELPISTTSFNIPEKVFRATKKSDPGSSESFWSHTLYRGPDGPEHKVKVHYCKSKHTTERVLSEYFMDKKILGFDIEWKTEANKNSGSKKNVSLVQLASEERIALFHISLYAGDKIEDLVAPSLKKIMEDPSITKTGVAIKADCTRLRKYLDIHAQGIFELSHLYKLVTYSASKDYKLINKMLVSLAQQVKEVLHLPLFKGEVRGSDWSQPLVMDQIVYAASDSYAGVQLFDALEQKRKKLDPIPPLPFHAELNKPIRIAEGIEIASEEDGDAEEPEPPASSIKQPKKLSSTYLAKASESLELDPDFEPTLQSMTTPSAPVAESKPKKVIRVAKSSLKPTPPKNPLIVAAATHADAYRATHHQNRAAPSSLRCYFLWHHNPALSISDIAALLREVPLQQMTVANYIADAVKLEKLPVEKERMREVLSMMPSDIIWRRYKAVAKECDMVQGDHNV